MIGEGKPPARLVVRRWYPAPQSLVFRAFTEAPLLERWFCPAPDIVLKVAELDLRAGGRYKFLYRFPDGTVIPVIGEFRKIDRPRQMIFTWTWEKPDPHAGVETQVTVDINPKGGGTEVVVTHEKFPTEEKMRQHEKGWAGTLERLGSLLTSAQDLR